MALTTRIFTLLNGKLIGTDPFGNRYYLERAKPKTRRRRRWVMYKGLAEPSKVPAEWHGWLHYTLDTPPTERNLPHYPWKKIHQPNLTGTKNAYRPPGHLLKGGHRSATTSDYEAWRP